MKWFDYNTLSNRLNSIEEAVFIVIGIILFVLFIIWFIDSLSKAVIIKKAGRSIGLGFIPIYKSTKNGQSEPSPLTTDQKIIHLLSNY